MAMIQERNIDFGLSKCGEITTSLLVGKKVFFLNCDMCEYKIQELNDFIRHICQNHVQELAPIKAGNTTNIEGYNEYCDEEMCGEWENSEFQERAKNPYAFKGFENVVIDEESVGFKEEPNTEVFESENCNEYEENAKNPYAFEGFEKVVIDEESVSFKEEPNTEVVESENCDEYEIEDITLEQRQTQENNVGPTKKIGQLKTEEKYTLKLIEAYKSFPALWDQNANEYNDKEAKNIQYQILLQKYKEMYPEATIIDLKRRINCIRTRYNYELKRRSKAGTKTNLYFFKALSFLRNEDGATDSNAEEEYLANEASSPLRNDNSLTRRSDCKNIETSTGVVNEIPENPSEICHVNEKKEEAEQHLTDEQKFLIEFVDLYHSLPALWKVNSTDYSNRDLKNIQYTILLKKYKEMYPGANMQEVKRRINVLRTCFRRALKRGPPYELFYFDKMRFLQNISDNDDEKGRAINRSISGKFTRADTLLNDEQFIELAKIYKKHRCLWHEKTITYRFTNRRREAVEEVRKELNAKCGLNLDKAAMEREILLMRRVCSNEKKEKLMCKRNETTYQRLCPYYDHLAFLEIDVKPFECEKCGQLLSNLGRYKTHYATHDNSPPFKCFICGHAFQLSTNLTVHLRRHVQDFTYNCEVCNKPCPTKSQLKIHMRYHTGEKPYVCDICGKSFRLTHEFKEHMLRHEKRALFKCDLCSRRFYATSALKDHIRTHLNVRDQICDICNKGFSTRKQLRQHRHIHDTEKRFECKICGKRFAQSAGISGHMKRHGTVLAPKNASAEENLPF